MNTTEAEAMRAWRRKRARQDLEYAMDEARELLGLDELRRILSTRLANEAVAAGDHAEGPGV